MIITREMAINELLKNDIFMESDIGNPAMEYYIKLLMDGVCLFDIDRVAWLNTLFGYDIGFNNANKINLYLYERDDEVLELEYTDKEKVKQIVDELGLNLDFSKWKTHDIPCYEYF